MCPFSNNTANNKVHQKAGRKGTPVSRIAAKGEVVNMGEMKPRFAGRNVIKLPYFDFAGKLFYLIVVVTEGKQVFFADCSLAVKVD